MNDDMNPTEGAEEVVSEESEVVAPEAPAEEPAPEETPSEEQAA